MAYGFDKSENGRWYVIDWAGNLMFDGDTYENSEEAYGAVEEHIADVRVTNELTEDEVEEMFSEYYAYPVDFDRERERHAACRQYKLTIVAARHGGFSGEYFRACRAQDRAMGIEVKPSPFDPR